MITVSGGGTITGEGDHLIVPNGTTVRTGNGPEITVLAGSRRVMPDGSVVGQMIRIGGFTLTDTNGTFFTVDRDGGVAPGSSPISVEGFSEPNKTITIKGSFTVPGDGTVDVPEGSTVTIDGTPTTALEGGLVLNSAGEINYAVTFDSRGGSAVARVLVEPGSTAARPADPVKAGFTFGGWYSDASCTIPWDFGTDTVEHNNLMLYAGWTAVSSGGGGGRDTPSAAEQAVSAVENAKNGETVKVELPGNGKLPGAVLDAAAGPCG